MNLLQALFSQEIEEKTFFEDTYPLTNDRLDSGEALAVVRSAIEPGQIGHVKFHGVRWRACCDHPQRVLVGTQVRVLGRRANVLVVEPMETITEQGSDPVYGGLFNAATTAS